MRALLAAVCMSLSMAAAAQADNGFDIRLKNLEEQLRCLVCQNQTLADSDAPLAQDLRREVRSLAVAGKNDDEIRQYLVARYGDFVLYKPPVKRTTWLLWFGPFGLLLVGGCVWWIILRRRGAHAHDEPSVRTDGATVDTGVKRARELLDDSRA